MKLLDRIYLNMYWCGNKGSGGGFIDEYMDKIFMIILYGLLMIIISLLLSIFKIDIKFGGILFVSGLTGFLSSERILKIYYTKDRKKMILSSYPKPSKLKYLVLFLLVFGSLAFMIFCAIITGVIYHRLII